MGDSEIRPGPTPEPRSAEPGAADPPQDGHRDVDRECLLRLARWFDTADSDTAHALFTAASGLYPARRLGVGGDEGDAVSAVTSWWRGPRVHVFPAYRGSLPPTADLDDRSGQRARLRDAAEAAAHWRRAAAREVHDVLGAGTASGADERADLSGPAFDVLMELFSAALAAGDPAEAPRSAGDLELDLRLHVQAAPEASAVLRGPEGRLSLSGLQLRTTPFSSGAGTVDAGDDPAPRPENGR